MPDWLFKKKKTSLFFLSSLLSSHVDPGAEQEGRSELGGKGEQEEKLSGFSPNKLPPLSPISSHLAFFLNFQIQQEDASSLI